MPGARKPPKPPKSPPTRHRQLLQKGGGTESRDCRNFMTQALPTCFEKLLTSTALYKWDDGVQAKIRSLTLKAVQVAAWV